MPSEPESVVDDPIDEIVEPGSGWTRTNVAEAYPGVLTSLSWTYHFEPTELAFRTSLARIGILRKDEVAVPERKHHRFAGVAQLGRATLSVDPFRLIADRMPGSSGDAWEKQFFGSVRPGVSSRHTRERYLHVLVKLPPAVWRSLRRLERMEAETLDWWRSATTELADAGADRARERLREARATMREAITNHGVVTMLAQGLYEQVRKTCAAAGRPGLETELLANDHAGHEASTVADLWDVSRGRMSMEQFLRRHGYHGPIEGMLHGRSWRENPAPVEALVETYKTMDDGAAPALQREKLLAKRERAIAELSGFGRGHRWRLRLLLPFARILMLRRESGRIIGYVRGNDVARAAARAIGRELAADGVLDDPEDVFHLTYDEVQGALTRSVKDVVAKRKECWRAYHAIELPMQFIGRAEPVVTAAADAQGPITGVAANQGLVEGRACVVTDPNEADDFQPGDVLVCQTTDPGWAALFVIASAVVIDIGGTMSHGAIVARELGIPCVIGTRTGTARIRTGDRLRVDGTKGAVEVLAP